MAWRGGLHALWTEQLFQRAMDRLSLLLPHEMWLPVCKAKKKHLLVTPDSSLLATTVRVLASFCSVGVVIGKI